MPSGSVRETASAGYGKMPSAKKKGMIGPDRKRKKHKGRAHDMQPRVTYVRKGR